MNEYDIVIAKRTLSDNVLKGTQGTIVMVYECPKIAYEVEFFNSNGDTIDILTVDEKKFTTLPAIICTAGRLFCVILNTNPAG